MRKSEFAAVLARRLGLRLGRLNSLVQRAAELDLLPMATGTHYPRLEPIELARMFLVGICDEGLGSVGAVISKYGGLPGPGSTLEETLGHALSRPESLAPMSSSLEIHLDDRKPYALLTIATADGARTLIFGDMPAVETVDRTVNVSGSALFAIALELAGRSAADVDKMLAGSGEMQPRSEAVGSGLTKGHDIAYR